jgi:hypothetical protein
MWFHDPLFHPHPASPVKGEEVLLKSSQAAQSSAPFGGASRGHPLCRWSLTENGKNAAKAFITLRYLYIKENGLRSSFLLFAP